MKLVDKEQINTISELFNNIYAVGKIPTECLKPQFTTMIKKPGAKDFQDYIIITCWNCFYKLYTRESIINLRNKLVPISLVLWTLLLTVQVLFQKCRYVSSNVFVCIIDYKRVFDSIRHAQKIGVMERTRIDGEDLKIIAHLYWNHRAFLEGSF